MNLHFVEDFYSKFSIPLAVQIVISIAVIFLLAFLLTRLTKLLHLPNVTAYMFTGVLIGPFVLNLIPSKIISEMSFISDVGLGIIGFSCGKFFDLKLIKDNGWKPLVISLIETCFTTAVIFLICLPFDLPMIACLILGVIAASTSASSTVMTVREYGCKGKFVNYMIEVIALNNVIVLFAFSILAGIVPVTLESGVNLHVWKDIFLPLVLNVVMLVVGFGIGILLAKVFISPTRTKDNRLILTVASMLVLVGLSGLCHAFDENISVSPLLSTMVLSATYKAFGQDEELFSQTENFCAPLLLLFFVLSGINLKLEYIPSIGVVGLVYFAVRFISKYSGLCLASLMTRTEKKIALYGGPLLYPQAGVAVGLATIASQIFSSVGKDDIGNKVATIAIAVAVVFEIFGPALAKLSLQKADVIDTSKLVKGKIVMRSSSMFKDTETVLSPEVLKRRNQLKKIQRELDKANNYIHTKAYTNEDFNNQEEDY